MNASGSKKSSAHSSVSKPCECYRFEVGSLPAKTTSCGISLLALTEWELREVLQFYMAC